MMLWSGKICKSKTTAGMRVSRWGKAFRRRGQFILERYEGSSFSDDNQDGGSGRVKGKLHSCWEREKILGIFEGLGLAL